MRQNRKGQSKITEENTRWDKVTYDMMRQDLPIPSYESLLELYSPFMVMVANISKV